MILGDMDRVSRDRVSGGQGGGGGGVLDVEDDFLY